MFENTVENYGKIRRVRITKANSKQATLIELSVL
jgi:hypothetical protein